MRIKVIRTPRARVVDGVDLRRFTPGQKYDVGSHLGALLLAEGWAEPLTDDEPALIVPFSDDDVVRFRDGNSQTESGAQKLRHGDQ